MTPPGRTALTAGLLVAAGALAVAAFWPARTRVGVDYAVSERRIPLWQKGRDFLQRDAHTRRLADSLSRDAPTPEAKALALFAWTRESIPPHPPGAPVIDDHVWSIIERGYGSNDQQADVFTTLLTYAGVPSYWILIGPDRPALPISLVLIDGEWRVFDVHNSVVFRAPSGRLAAVSEIAHSVEIVRHSAAASGIDPDAYARWFDGFSPPPVPDVLRAEMQMPRKRLAYELSRVFR